MSHLELISSALGWLSGTPAGVTVERERSYHGSPMHIVSVKLAKRREARAGVTHLGPDLLNGLSVDLEDRIDEDNVLHVRLCLDSLVGGTIVQSMSSAADDVVKGRIKLEVYPGSTALEVAESLLEQAVVKATERGMPPALE